MDLTLAEICCKGEEGIVEIEGGRFETSLRIDQIHLSYINGTKGATRKRLETETKSKITIPEQGSGGDIVISADTKKSVASAMQRIYKMVSSRKRQNFTHFVSLPFNGPTFRSGFAKFKKEVLEEFKDCGIDETLFVKPERLHMTVGIMFLSDELERKMAASILEECKDQVVKPVLKDKKLRIIMTGVDCMNGNPSVANVLYGKVHFPDGEHIIPHIADGIVDRFSKKGLMEKEREHVKLHVTLMNSILKNRRAKGRKRRNRETFDASQIVEKYREFYFGEEIISAIELSTRHSFSEETGYYQAAALINIP